MNTASPSTGFPTTLWSTVQRAGDPSSPEAQEALERLCQTYWPVLYTYARRHGHDTHTAQDLTQTFFAHFIERGYLRAADRARGRFRTFLLTSFQYFLVHEWEKVRAIKRGGGFVLVSWEDHRTALESRVTSPPSPSPETQYDREWALTVMERALTRLRNEFAATGRARHWEILGQFLNTEAAPGQYHEAATLLGLADRAVTLTVHRLRRRYGRYVRDEIRDTVAADSEVEDEMGYLIELICG